MKITDIIIDEAFEDFLPVLQADERAALKEEIEQDGFTDPLIVWQHHGELIDGYNRYRIWQELGADPDKAPDIVERKFADRMAVMEWMFHHQVARRNLTPAQRATVALKMKPAIEERAAENQKRKPNFVSTNSSKQKVDTRKEVAKIAGVSEDTVRKTEKVLKDGSAEVKEAMQSGELSANKAFEKIKAAEPKPPGRKEQPSTKRAATLLAKVTGDFQKAADNLAPLVREFDAIKSADSSFQKKHQELLGHHSRLFQICEDGKRILKTLNNVWAK